MLIFYFNCSALHGKEIDMLGLIIEDNEYTSLVLQNEIDIITMITII